MRLGDFELHLIVAGGWHPDAGTMFGVVPKVLWERQRRADGDNLIRAACVGLVVRHRGRVIVCETGIGTKLSEKRARQAGQWEPDGLLTALNRLAIRPADVDVVLTTHLHWDHSGGFTRRGPDGSLELTFPKARHFVQRSEWDFALAPDPRSRAGYVEEDFIPVADAGLVELVEGDAEILPGLELRLTAGHTPGHELIIFRAGDLACVMTGDLISVRPHLRIGWNNSADLDVLRVLKEKARILDEASRHRWVLVLGHETEQPAGYVDPDSTWTPEPALASESQSALG